MAVFLLFAGLVIDTGIGFRERREAQNLSDLASMAGTKAVAEYYIDSPSYTSSEVWDAIEANLDANGCEAVAGCTWTAEYVRPNGPTDEADLGPVADAGPIPAGAQGVRVTASQSAETFFMKLAGFDEIDVSADATAMTSQLLDGAPGGVLLPMAVFDTEYEVGTTYQLQDGMIGPGNFGWLTWTGSQAMTDLSEWVCVPSNPEIPEWPAQFGGQVGQKNGQSTAGMRTCMDEYIASQSVVLIPMWDQANGPGANLQYNLVGLAAFILQDYEQTVISTITGEFVGFYNLSPVPGGYGAPPCDLSDPSCNSKTNFIGLVR